MILQYPGCNTSMSIIIMILQYIQTQPVLPVSVTKYVSTDSKPYSDSKSAVCNPSLKLTQVCEFSSDFLLRLLLGSPLEILDCVELALADCDAGRGGEVVSGLTSAFTGVGVGVTTGVRIGVLMLGWYLTTVTLS